MSKLMILAKSGCHDFGSILDTHVMLPLPFKREKGAILTCTLKKGPKTTPTQPPGMTHLTIPGMSKMTCAKMSHRVLPVSWSRFCTRQKWPFRDFGIFAKKCPRKSLIKKWPFCKNGKKRQKCHFLRGRKKVSKWSFLSFFCFLAFMPKNVT